MITIYTDGSSKGNPGPGGCAAIIKCGNSYKEISKGFRVTTNNRMELLAIIFALEYISLIFYVKDISVFSDSKYVVNSIQKGWLDKWIKNDFKNIKNKDLWIKIYKFIKTYMINFYWIKGHSDNIYNNRCDFLAKNIIRKDISNIDHWFENYINY